LSSSHRKVGTDLSLRHFKQTRTLGRSPPLYGSQQSPSIDERLSSPSRSIGTKTLPPPSSPRTRSTAPPRSQRREEQRKRNSHALSLEQPLKSCFRRCKANAQFSLPTSPPSSRQTSSNRRVVFSDPIDDGGNYPRHPRIVVEEEEELETTEEEELEPLFASPSAAPRRPSTLPSRRYSHTRSSPVVASLQVARPRSDSRLKTRPLPQNERRQRSVAYTHYYA